MWTISTVLRNFPAGSIVLNRLIDWVGMFQLVLGPNTWQKFGKAMSNSPPARDIKVTIGEHAFRFEGRWQQGPRGRKLRYKATAESGIEIARTFGDLKLIILIAEQSADVSMEIGVGGVLRVWEISDETSCSQEDMLLGLVGKSWQFVDPVSQDERIKALHKSAMRVDFWVEPQEERPWKRRKFTDAELICGNESFEVHRGLLAAKSEVFEAAFESAFQEGVRAKYEIKDSSKAAVKGALAKKTKPWSDSIALFCLFTCVSALLQMWVIDSPKDPAKECCTFSTLETFLLKAMKPFQRYSTWQCNTNFILWQIKLSRIWRQALIATTLDWEHARWRDT